jgi:phosphotransferase system enzyme I (PtsP)
MLKVLRRIVQEVNSAHDFGEALQIIVERVRDAINTEACTVFLVDKFTDELIFMATDGLNPDCVGKVRLKKGEGLVGLVVKREEPINVDDAPSHPNFIYHAEVGEDLFKAFLGVPIIHHRELQGIIIIQQQQKRKFDESEEAFLVTISAQLAGIIAHAQATGTIQSLLNFKNNNYQREDICLEGIVCSPGVGIGKAVLIYQPADLDAVPDRIIEDISAEIVLFKTALKKARDSIKALRDKMGTTLPKEEAELFEVYLRILDSTGISVEVIEVIKQGNWAQGSLRKVIKKHIRGFEGMEDSYLRERAADIRDLGTRILAYLQDEEPSFQHYPLETILIGEEITPTILAQVPEGQLRGVISAQGSNNSHTAILARALGIPTVMGVEGLLFHPTAYEGKDVIVDGYYGQVYISPSPALMNEYLALVEEAKELDISLSELRGLPAVTPDGHSVSLFVNTGLPADAGLSLSVGAEGVGLFRTEIPFMMRERFPAEEEQRIIYRQLLKAFSPRPVIMRTLDVGGDKPLPYFQIEEDNPFLGWRGIRLTLDHPEIFLVQLRAMFKASHEIDNLRIMLPMISSLTEFDEAKELIDKAYQEVCDEGYNVKFPPIGVMIEVPSAVYQARGLAQRADFLSIGSNDLAQYILAVDRNNSRVANLYDTLHPAVLYALQHVVDIAHSEGKQVSICGEMAGDPASVIPLMAIGFDALSMSSIALPRVKWVIRNITMARAKELLKEIMSMDKPKLIRYQLEQALEQADLGGLIRAGN